MSASKGNIIMAVLPSWTSQWGCMEMHKPPELDSFCLSQA